MFNAVFEYEVGGGDARGECRVPVRGLTMVFEHMGGVPAMPVMDSATGAGHRDSRGEVTLTALFSLFL